MALGLTVHSMWNKKLVDISQKATKYDESVLDNKMNVNAAKEPIFFFHPRIFTPCTIKGKKGTASFPKNIPAVYHSYIRKDS